MCVLFFIFNKIIYRTFTAQTICRRQFKKIPALLKRQTSKFDHSLLHSSEIETRKGKTLGVARMSTWRIFSGDRNDFRWEPVDQQLQLGEFSDAVAEDTRRLPSMADLLLLGMSMLLLIRKIIFVLTVVENQQLTWRG